MEFQKSLEEPLENCNRNIRIYWLKAAWENLWRNPWRNFKTNLSVTGSITEGVLEWTLKAYLWEVHERIAGECFGRISKGTHSAIPWRITGLLSQEIFHEKSFEKLFKESLQWFSDESVKKLQTKSLTSFIQNYLLEESLKELFKWLLLKEISQTVLSISLETEACPHSKPWVGQT